MVLINYIMNVEGLLQISIIVRIYSNQNIRYFLGYFSKILYRKRDESSVQYFC